MISRPSLFLTVSVRHPRLPFPVWLAVPSLSLYALALVGARFIGKGLRGRPLPLPPQRVAALVRQAMRAFLFSGSYLLVDVRVPAEGLRVKVRLV